jgi:WD40 repeat protein
VAQFPGEGTVLQHMPHSDLNKGRVVAIGYKNGLIRVVAITADGVTLLKSFKAHDDAITGIKYSKDLKMMVTSSISGEMFFFECDGHRDVQKYEPICTFKLPDNAGIKNFSWNNGDKSLIFGCDNGYVYEIPRPEASEIDSSDTFFWDKCVYKTWKIKIMEFQMEKNQKKDEVEEEKKRRMRLRGELPPEDEEPEEDWDP